jgi:hypothetical protein
VLLLQQHQLLLLQGVQALLHAASLLQQQQPDVPVARSRPLLQRCLLGLQLLLEPRDGSVQTRQALIGRTRCWSSRRHHGDGVAQVCLCKWQQN